MTPRTARLLRLGLSAIIVAALIVFARKVNWHDTWHSIVKADWRLLALAALVNLASLVLKGVRWWVFLRPIGSPSLWLSIRATFAGAGLNNILVANGGEAARVVFVSRAARIPSASVLATLALDRLFELIGYVTMLALSISILALPPSLTRTRPFAWAVLVAMAALMVYLVRRPKRMSEPAAATADSWRGRLATYFRHFGSAIGGISTGPRFAVAMALSVGSWALQVATYDLTARAAHLDLPLVGTLAALLAVNIGFALRATPGNVGVFQGLYALTAAAFGLDKDQAIAVALLIQTQQIVPVTLLGVAAAPEFIFKRHETERAGVDDRRPRTDETQNRSGAGSAP